MLKSSNLDSIIEAVNAAAVTAAGGTIAQRPNNTLDIVTPTGSAVTTAQSNDGNSDQQQFAASEGTGQSAVHRTTMPNTSLAAVQLAAGFLQVVEPPLVRVRGHLKELIGKQNKIYIDLSAEKYKLDNAEMAKLNEMMRNVKVYREKLIKIKKQMQHIYQRTKALKKRAVHIQTCKQKELQRILEKQQQEESLIAGKQT